MSQPTPKQPSGDFYAPVNRYKQPGDNLPIFKGHLTKPDDQAQFPFTLWAFEYTDQETGEVRHGFGGSIDGVPANIPAADQIAALCAPKAGTDATVANLTLRPGQVVLFPNGFKAEAPEKNRPDLFGWINPLDGSPVFQAGVWIKQFDNSQRPYLSGSTQYPLPGRTTEFAPPSAAAFEPTPEPAAAKRRAGKGGEGRL